MSYSPCCHVRTVESCRPVRLVLLHRVARAHDEVGAKEFSESLFARILEAVLVQVVSQSGDAISIAIPDEVAIARGTWVRWDLYVDAILSNVSLAGTFWRGPEITTSNQDGANKKQNGSG